MSPSLTSRDTTSKHATDCNLNPISLTSRDTTRQHRESNRAGAPRLTESDSLKSDNLTSRGSTGKYANHNRLVVNINIGKDTNPQ